MTSTAYMFWDMNSCRLTSVDNNVLDSVQTSFLNLIKQYDCTSAALRGYLNFHDYRLQADEIWALGQYNVKVERFFDSSNPIEAEVELLAQIMRNHTPNLEGFPELPVFLTSGNLELIEEVRFERNGNMVLCTSLPQADRVINQLVYSGMDVYQWDPSLGVGQRYAW